MKYIKFTYVDYKTRRPVSQAPATRGPDIPKGIEHKFSIESSYPSGVPVMYGYADDDFVLESWMREVDEVTFNRIFKNEIKDRASARRKSLEASGVDFKVGDDTYHVRTDESSLQSLYVLYMGVSVSNDDCSIDFEVAPYHWITLSRKDFFALVDKVGAHIRGCRSWCRRIHEKIDSTQKEEILNEIIQEISIWNGPEPVITTEKKEPAPKKRRTRKKKTE